MPMGLDSVIVTPTGHRFFFQLVTAQAATAAYLSGTMAELQGAWHSWPDDSPISQLCFTRNVEVQFQPSEVLRPISRNAWPSALHLEFRERGDRPTSSVEPTAIQLLMSSLYEHAFVTYFENNRSAMKTRHGAVSRWPGVLAFARIVRHAFAHGGKVNILDGTSATWGGFKYSQADNGKRVMYNDLSAGDLTLLMVEMDAEF
jgi:hypothetical protein